MIVLSPWESLGLGQDALSWAWLHQGVQVTSCAPELWALRPDLVSWGGEIPDQAVTVRART